MKNFSQITSQKIKQNLSITEVLKYYGGECTNKSSGSWWCLIHEQGGKKSGHKTPSLVAKDATNTATCMSQGCFQADDIFGIIAKMENLNVKNDFYKVKNKACEIAKISINSYNNIQTIQSPKTKKEENMSKKIIIEELNIEHIQYLQSIGISKDTANVFQLKARYDYILYPQIENNEIIGYKGISITKDQKTGKSKMFFEKRKTSLWGNFDKNKHIIFVEGEKDCMRLFEQITQENKQNEYNILTITTGAKTIPSDILNIIRKLQPSNISIIYDNDKAGIAGSKKLAKALIEEVSEVSVYYFNSNNKEGYDITDFLNEGGEIKDIWNLKKEKFKKEQETLQKSYPRYILNENSILETLVPDKILYTGYKEIDEKCPIVVGENSIIVGRTGKGKTILGVNFVNGILKNNVNSKVVVFSIELKKKVFLQRLLGGEYNIENWKIKKGFIGDKDTTYSLQKEEYIKHFDRYIKTYSNRLLIIDDIHSIEQIEEVLDNLKSLNFVPDYILIDYVNILTIKNLTDTTKHIQISTWIKFLTKEKNIHIQAICQANRATKENDDGYARTENLADSDQYGRDAFIVYSIKTEKETDIYSINPTKNRNGKSEEEIKLKWNAESGRIYEGNFNNINNRL